MNKDEKKKLQQYIDLVQKVARVEHRRIPSHMVEYEELLSIGIIAIQVMIKNKTPEQLEKYNAAYIVAHVLYEMFLQQVGSQPMNNGKELDFHCLQVVFVL